MKVKELIDAIPGARIQGKGDVPVSGVTADSRAVAPGAVFVAIRGFRQDGHRFAEGALRAGAAAVVIEDAETWARLVEPKASNEKEGPGCIVRVPATRPALSRLAARFHGDPSSRLGLIGVTGTNGKTTTTYLIRAILETAGYRTGLIGTVAYRVGDQVLPAPHTTPEAPELHGLLARMAETGSRYAVMEVSSHALELDRVADCRFDVGVFTNLTQDHLDFHATMETYLRAKLRLFEGLGRDNPKKFPRRAIVNADDPHCDRVIAASTAPCWTYAVERKADLRAERPRFSIEGIRCEVRTTIRGAERFEIASPLVGRYNLSNLLAAIGAALSQEVPVDAVREGVARTAGAPGRFERVDEGQGFLVVVDYAHTDDALARVLGAVAEFARGRILTVFGCGGDRDRGKRPKMGRVAASMSDQVYVTSDNPRTERPEAILAEVVPGVEAAVADGARRPAGVGVFAYRVIANRREAIFEAIRAARAGDVVVIAGKGHEDYQIVGDRKLHFDDREVAREALREAAVRG